MPAESRGATASNRAQYFPMGPMEPAEVAVDEAIALRANDIGHLEEGLVLGSSGLKAQRLDPLRDRQSLTDVLSAAADSPLLRAECG